MFGMIPWRRLQAVTWDALQSVLHKIQSMKPGLKTLPTNSKGIPVYVMLPLDVTTRSALIKGDFLQSYLNRLASIGVHGVMVDCWWGLCEPDPQEYDFAEYVNLAKMCRSADLKLQVVLSFHACGGNIGDTVNIPLPEWVISAGDTSKFWFTDRFGNTNSEYISFGADHEAILPTRSVKSSSTENNASNNTFRTPIQAYADFAKAFKDEMVSVQEWGTTITEIHVGLGPCGELRYPSYPSNHWRFPGIGQFQCFDKYLLQDLANSVQNNGTSKPLKANNFPPLGIGSYNDRPYDTEFFRDGMRTAEGRFFLKWYSGKLLEHGKDVLDQICKEFLEDDGDAEQVQLAVKISGIHWWKFSKSRAAEATCGYIQCQGKTIYEDIVKLLKSKRCILNFTCLEMRTIDQPWSARCGPLQLVAEVFRYAKRHDVDVAGENALQRFDSNAFNQIAYAMKWCAGRKVGFTLLRLCNDLMTRPNLERLEHFVSTMQRISK